jgi:hypothetical protein
MLTRRATRRKRSVSFIAAGYAVIRRNGRGRSGPALQARHDCRSLQIRRVQARLIRAEQQDHPRRCIETGADRRRPWKSASSFRQKATTTRGDDLVCGRERICVIHALADPRFIARAEGPWHQTQSGVASTPILVAPACTATDGRPWRRRRTTGVFVLPSGVASR